MGTFAFKNHFVVWIPPDGTFYYALGPDDRLAAGAVTVTCHPTEGVAGLASRHLEVVQTATRRQIKSGGTYETLLDIVVRNNAHVGGPGTGVSSFWSYTSVITP